MKTEDGIYICPACDGPGETLGQLGALLWHRCQNCGMMFHSEPEEEGNAD